MLGLIMVLLTIVVVEYPYAVAEPRPPQNFKKLIYSRYIFYILKM